MIKFQCLLGLGAPQNINNMVGAEYLTRSTDTGKELLGSNGDVYKLLFTFQAVIT